MQTWERRGIRATWAARGEWGGVIGTLPTLLLVIVLRAFYFVILSIILPCNLVTKTWSSIFPWSRQNRQRRHTKRRDKYRDKSLAERILKTASAKAIRLDEGSASRQIQQTTDLFFSRFPPELRQIILVHAFGHRTLHIDLDFQRPPCFVEDTAHISDELKEEWIWRGVVCHRSPPEDNPLSLGRLRSSPGQYPEEEKCLRGRTSCCGKWPGEWPGKCEVGTMGWLLTCRQAYMEGMKVLYGTNTLQVSSHVLLRGLQDMLSSTVISSITSLELVWNPQLLHIKRIFEGINPQDKNTPFSPLLPSLTHMHIYLTSLEYVVIGVSQADGMQIRSLDELATCMPLSLDAVLLSIAPPTADVTVTCEDFEWFRLVEQSLAESQGRENMRHQQSEFGGPRFWRQIPAVKDDTSGSLSLSNKERVKEGEKNQQGYWIHLPQGIMELYCRGTRQPQDPFIAYFRT